MLPIILDKNIGTPCLTCALMHAFLAVQTDYKTFAFHATLRDIPDQLTFDGSQIGNICYRKITCANKLFFTVQSH